MKKNIFIFGVAAITLMLFFQNCSSSSSGGGGNGNPAGEEENSNNTPEPEVEVPEPPRELRPAQVKNFFGGASTPCYINDRNKIRCMGNLKYYDDSTGEDKLYIATDVSETSRFPVAFSLISNNSHVCITATDNKNIYCKGSSNSQLQTGSPNSNGGGWFGPMVTTETVTQLHTSGVASVALLANNKVQCWGYRSTCTSSENIAFPGVILDFTKKIVKAQAGGWHGCVLHDDGEINCWSGGQSKKFNSPTSKKFVDMVSSTQFHICATTEDRQLYCWYPHSSSDSYKPLGVPSQSTPTQRVNIPDVKYVSTYGDSTCAVTEGASGDELWCWGRSYTFLADRDYSGATEPVQITQLPNKLESVHFLSSEMCVVGGDNKNLFCWGTTTKVGKNPVQIFEF